MAVPTFVAAGDIAGSTDTSTPLAPAGLMLDDIEFLVVETADEAVTLSTAAGFAEITGSPVSVANASAAIATRGTLYWRRWNGSDGDPEIADAGDHVIAQRYAVRGCIGSGNPWDFVQTSSEATEDTSGSATGNTTTGDDRLILIIGGSAKPDTQSTTEVSGFTNANLTSITEQADNARQAGNGGHVFCVTGTKATAGATGATTYTKASSGYKWHYVIALVPTGGGGGGGTSVPVFVNHLRQQGIG